MSDNKYTAEIETLIEKLEDKYTPRSMKYVLLTDLARIANAAAQDGAEPIDTLECYLYVGGSYHALGHYIFALTYYDKAMAILEPCKDNIADNGDLAEKLYKGFEALLDIYRKMKKPRAMEQLLPIIQEVMPDSFDAIKNRKGSHLKTDPIQYTERYMAILPELEAKIEAELASKGITGRREISYHYRHVKEEILLRDYGIKWKSLRQLNPRVKFD